MNRAEFLYRTGRYILLIFLGIIVLALGRRVVTADDCNACAGKGICKGDSDCTHFKSVKNGK